MSTSSTPNDSPISPLHQPDRAAQIVVPQAPLGNATNGPTSHVPGMGSKALFSKKMIANSRNPMFVSPTDSLMTPCTRKLNAVKEKHFQNVKPIALFGKKQAEKEDDENMDNHGLNANDVDDEGISPQAKVVNALASSHLMPTDDDENPF